MMQLAFENILNKIKYYKYHKEKCLIKFKTLTMLRKLQNISSKYFYQKYK